MESRADNADKCKGADAHSDESPAFPVGQRLTARCGTVGRLLLLLFELTFAGC